MTQNLLRPVVDPEWQCTGSREIWGSWIAVDDPSRVSTSEGPVAFFVPQLSLSFLSASERHASLTEIYPGLLLLSC